MITERVFETCYENEKETRMRVVRRGNENMKGRKAGQADRQADRKEGRKEEFK